MFALILLALLIAVTSGVMSCILKKFDIIHIFVLSLALDTVVYAGISYVLYTIKKYTIERSLFVALGLFCIFFAVLLFLGKRITYSLSIQKSAIPIMLIIVLTIVSMFVLKSGYYGINDKVGAVQSKAMKLKDEYYIYGLSDNEYYENIYTEEELEEVNEVLEPLNEKQKDADTAIASVMALIGRLFGYESMIYTYVYMFSLIIFVTYIICSTYIKKYGLTWCISGGVTVVASLIMVFTFVQKETVISWNELYQIDKMSNATSAYVIDKDMLDDMYIPVKCMTMGYIIPETGDIQKDEERFFDVETLLLDNCSNFNIITSNERFDDEYIDELVLNKAYSGDFCIYRNSWKYYYDGNFENADNTGNYYMIFVVLAGIISLMYSIGVVHSYNSDKDTDIVLAGIISFNIYALIYLIITAIQVQSFDKYSGQIFTRTVNISTMIAIFISAVVFVIIDILKKHSYDNEIKVRYTFNKLSTGIIAAAFFVSVIILILLGVNKIYTGDYGELQQACVSLITGNVTDINMQIINNISFLDMIKVTNMVFAGAMLQPSLMMCGFAIIAFNAGTLLATVIYIVLYFVMINSNANIISVIVSCTVAVITVIGIVGININKEASVYSWSDVEMYLSDIKSSDVLVYDKSADKILIGIMTGLRNIQTIEYTGFNDMNSGENVFEVLEAVEEATGVSGNQVYYVTSNVSDINNTEFMMYNNYEYSQYNLDVYPKYSVVNKDINMCMYRIDKLVAGGSEQ